MANFIAIVRGDGDAGYTASFPDFPACAVGALSVDLVIAKARETLLAHIERLLEANHKLPLPTAADTIERDDALLLAAVEVPDDIGISLLNLAIPTLSLARIDSFARRHGLTHAALFVEAVNRWAMQETMRERRAEMSDGPTLFDLGNPLELTVEQIVADQQATATQESSPNATKEDTIQCNVDDITAELVRLLEERPESQPVNHEVVEAGHPAPESQPP